MDNEFYDDEDMEEMYTDDIDDYDESFYEKKRGKSFSGKTKGITILFGILCVILLAIVFGCKLDTVQVKGNKTYTNEEIKEIIGFSDNESNTVLCKLKHMRCNVSDVPFVESIDVQIVDRHTICINVNETNILGCFQSGKTYYYFDENGIVKEAIGEKRERLPVIQGVTVDNLDLDQKIVIEKTVIYNGIMSVCQLLYEHDISSEKIEIDDKGEFTIDIDGKIKVDCGAPVMLETKIAEVANILPELQEMQKNEKIKGVLHLENYDSNKDSIVFTKEN